jgi:hypothetical protein
MAGTQSQTQPVHSGTHFPQTGKSPAQRGKLSTERGKPPAKNSPDPSISCQQLIIKQRILCLLSTLKACQLTKYFKKTPV